MIFNRKDRKEIPEVIVHCDTCVYYSIRKKKCTIRNERPINNYCDIYQNALLCKRIDLIWIAISALFILYSIGTIIISDLAWSGILMGITWTVSLGLRIFILKRRFKDNSANKVRFSTLFKWL